MFQVRNLCYMVTRREKMKHTLCDLQEKIFHLQIQLLEEDIAGGKTERERENTWVCVCGDVSNSSHLNMPVLKPFTFTHSSTAAKAANTYSVHQRKKKKQSLESSSA